jgi:hypothetical protein
MLVGVDVGPPLLLECLKRVGSESLLVNGGRGMVATSMAYANCGYAELAGLAAVAKNCLIGRSAGVYHCCLLQ